MNLCKVLETDADHLVQKVHSFDKSKIKYLVLFRKNMMAFTVLRVVKMEKFIFLVGLEKSIFQCII